MSRLVVLADLGVSAQRRNYYPSAARRVTAHG